MRKTLILMIVSGLIVGGLGAPAGAKKKKPKAAVAVEKKFFLRSTGCPASSDNSDFLSLTDGDEAIQCIYTGSGIRNTIGEETGTVGAEGQNAFSDRATATRVWDTIDGTPIVLDTTKTITGQIWTSGGSCFVNDPAPCSPVTVGAGETTMDISLVGKVGGEEVTIGEVSETYQVQPNTLHEIKLDIKIDPALAGKVFETIELRTWQGGTAAGHGVVNTNGDNSSFIAVPALAKK